METYEYLKAVLHGKDAVTTHRSAPTYVFWGESSIAVFLHETQIITALPSGDIILNTGGWFTATIKDRLNHFLRGYSVYAKNKVWRVRNTATGEEAEWKTNKFLITADGKMEEVD